MSGVHMALRTLWMRIDLPLKRSSAAALSERIATRSSTALRVSVDDRRDAPRGAHRQLAHDGAAWRRLAGGEVRGRHHLRAGHGRRHGHDPEGDLAEGDDVVLRRLRLVDAGAVQEGAVGGAEVLDADPVLRQGDLGVAPRDRGVVDGDVARDRPADDQGPALLQVNRLFAGGGEQLEHRAGIYLSPRREPAPAPAAPPAPSAPSRRTRAPGPSRPRSPRPPARAPGP